MTRFSIFLKIRRKILPLLLLMVILEAVIFATVISLQKKLDVYRCEQKNIDTILKSAANIIVDTHSTHLTIVKNGSEGLEIIKNILSANKIFAQNITVQSSQDFITYTISGKSNYTQFVQFLTAIRKSENILRINSYSLQFIDEGKLNYTVEIQSMNSMEKSNAKK